MWQFCCNPDMVPTLMQSHDRGEEQGSKIYLLFTECLRAIGTTQRRLAWPLHLLQNIFGGVSWGCHSDKVGTLAVAVQYMVEKEIFFGTISHCVTSSLDWCLYAPYKKGKMMIEDKSKMKYMSESAWIAPCIPPYSQLGNNNMPNKVMHRQGSWVKSLYKPKS